MVKVTLHVWTSNWGRRPQKLWINGTVDARTEGKWAYPLPSFGVRGYYPREICEDIGSKLCNSVHFGFWSLKNKHFKQKHSNVHQLPTSKLPLTTDFGQKSCSWHDWRPVQEKVYNWMFYLDFVWSIWWHQVIKSWTENRRFFVPLLKVRRTLPSLPYRPMFRVPWMRDENKMWSSERSEGENFWENKRKTLQICG